MAVTAIAIWREMMVGRAPTRSTSRPVASSMMSIQRYAAVGAMWRARCSTGACRRPPGARPDPVDPCSEWRGEEHETASPTARKESAFLIAASARKWSAGQKRAVSRERTSRWQLELPATRERARVTRRRVLSRALVSCALVVAGCGDGRDARPDAAAAADADSTDAAR